MDCVGLNGARARGAKQLAMKAGDIHDSPRGTHQGLPEALHSSDVVCSHLVTIGSWGRLLPRMCGTALLR